MGFLHVRLDLYDPPFCVVLLEQFLKRAYAEMDSILANTAVKLFI